MNKETILNKHLTYGEDTYLAGQRDNILAAMEEFAQSQNDGKPIVSGSLPLFEQFVISDEKVNGKQTEFIEDSVGGSEKYFSWSVIERWFRRK